MVQALGQKERGRIMTDKSILILPVRPYACGECPLQGVGICEAEKGGCPLRYVSMIEHKVRPLSKEKYIKIIAE